VDVIKLLNELEALIENQPTWMGATWSFHADEYLDLTNKIRASLPEEVKRASRLTADSEKVISGARETAEQALEDAQQNAEQIRREARASAERLLREAEGQANKMIASAETEATTSIEDARSKSEKMLRDATAESEKLVSQSELVRLATAQAREIITSAEYEAKDLRKGADSYAHVVMTDLDRTVGELAKTIERGLTRLDQRVDAHEKDKNHSNGWAAKDLAGTRNGKG
jgi:vacuolar-type H+-ATPase subunit H